LGKAVRAWLFCILEMNPIVRAITKQALETG
jgi:hypothetical protein